MFWLGVSIFCHSLPYPFKEIMREAAYRRHQFFFGDPHNDFVDLIYGGK